MLLDQPADRQRLFHVGQVRRSARAPRGAPPGMPSAILRPSAGGATPDRRRPRSPAPAPRSAQAVEVPVGDGLAEPGVAPRIDTLQETPRPARPARDAAARKASREPALRRPTRRPARGRACAPCAPAPAMPRDSEAGRGAGQRPAGRSAAGRCWRAACPVAPPIERPQKPRPGRSRARRAADHSPLPARRRSNRRPPAASRPGRAVVGDDPEPRCERSGRGPTSPSEVPSAPASDERRPAAQLRPARHASSPAPIAGEGAVDVLRGPAQVAGRVEGRGRGRRRPVPAGRRPTTRRGAPPTAARAAAAATISCAVPSRARRAGSRPLRHDQAAVGVEVRAHPGRVHLQPSSDPATAAARRP